MKKEVKVCKNCKKPGKLVWSRFLKGDGNVYGWFCGQKCKVQEQLKKIK